MLPLPQGLGSSPTDQCGSLWPLLPREGGGMKNQPGLYCLLPLGRAAALNPASRRIHAGLGSPGPSTSHQGAALA